MKLSQRVIGVLVLAVAAVWAFVLAAGGYFIMACVDCADEGGLGALLSPAFQRWCGATLVVGGNTVLVYWVLSRVRPLSVRPVALGIEAALGLGFVAMALAAAGWFVWQR